MRPGRRPPSRWSSPRSCSWGTGSSPGCRGTQRRQSPGFQIMTSSPSNQPNLSWFFFLHRSLTNQINHHSYYWLTDHSNVLCNVVLPHRLRDEHPCGLPGLSRQRRHRLSRRRRHRDAHAHVFRGRAHRNASLACFIRKEMKREVYYNFKKIFKNVKTFTIDKKSCLIGKEKNYLIFFSWTCPTTHLIWLNRHFRSTLKYLTCTTINTALSPKYLLLHNNIRQGQSRPLCSFVQHWLMVGYLWGDVLYYCTARTGADWQYGIEREGGGLTDAKDQIYSYVRWQTDRPVPVQARRELKHQNNYIYRLMWSCFVLTLVIARGRQVSSLRRRLLLLLLIQRRIHLLGCHLDCLKGMPLSCSTS